jgi:hypothetical protein
MPDSSEAILRIHTPRGGTVAEIREYLEAVENAYEHLYAFELQAEQVKERIDAADYWHRRDVRVKTLRVARNPHLVVLPGDRLRLHAVEVRSPGVWEFLGSLNPLETLRKYLEDRHRRRQDREYREPAERERLTLENERLRTQVVKERLDLFREVGIPEEKIREALTIHVIQPLQNLDRFRDSGLIEDAETVEVPSESQQE